MVITNLKFRLIVSSKGLNKMTQTYYQKENIYLWYFVVLLCVGALIFGYTLVRYFAWQVFPIIVIGAVKIYKLHKNPETPVIELDENGITLLTAKDNPFYLFKDISSIQMNSKSINGFLKLKSQKKKVIINSVAIAIDDQKEIAAFVNSKITQL